MRFYLLTRTQYYILSLVGIKAFRYVLPTRIFQDGRSICDLPVRLCNEFEWLLCMRCVTA